MNKIFYLPLLYLMLSCGARTPTIETRNASASGDIEQGLDNLSPDTAEKGDVDSEPSEEAPQKVKVLLDPSENGPFEFDFYDNGLDSDAYRSARVFFPIPTIENPGPFPATTTTGGFTNTKEDMYWLAERLTSHGFIVIAFTPTNNQSLNPQIWNNGHKGSIAMLESENQNIESPIFSLVDMDNLGVSGFSMGGAGTILAANDLGDKIKVAAPFNAFQPPSAEMTAATLFVAGSEDRVAGAGGIKQSYNSLNGASKAYTNFAGYGHDMTDPGIFEEDISTYVVAWYHLHLYANNLYETHFTGSENQEDLLTGVFDEGGNYEVVLIPN